MRQLAPSGGHGKPPAQRELVDARAALQARFQPELAHAGTATGARTAADTLLAASHDEADMAIKWLMLEEARRLGAAAGSAQIVSRAIALASAVFDVDEISLELESLREIPLRALDPERASRLAEAAERVAVRADVDRRDAAAAAARRLAYKAWQRAGNTAAARRVADR